MKRTDKRVRLSAWLICCLLCFIWGNSLLPGKISGALSDALKNILAHLLPGEVPGVTTGGGLLRKIAHFTEFAALGAAFVWRFGMLEKRKIMALVFGFGVACVDETIQAFVPDRGPAIRDVAIDTCGVAAGMILLLLICKITRKSKQSKENKTL
jgi:VanZ family protein